MSAMSTNQVWVALGGDNPIRVEGLEMLPPARPGLEWFGVITEIRHRIGHTRIPETECILMLHQRPVEP